MKKSLTIIALLIIIQSIWAVEYSRNSSHVLIPVVDVSLYRLYAYESTVYQLSEQLLHPTQEIIEKEPRRIRRQIELAEGELLCLIPHLVNMTIESEHITENYLTFNIKGSLNKEYLVDDLLSLTPERKRVLVSYRTELNENLRSIDSMLRVISSPEMIEDQVTTDDLLTKLNELNANHWEFQGQLSALRRDWEAALEHYKVALNFNPAMPTVFRRLYQIYDILEDREKGMKALEDMLQLEPTDIDALYRLGKIAEHEGNSERAVVYYERLLAIENNYPEITYYLAVYYYELDDRDQATKYAIQGAQISPIPIETAKNLVSLLLELDHPQETKPLLQMLLQKEPRNADLYQHLGDISYEKRDYAQALIFYEQTIKIRPDDFQILFHLANCHFNLNNYSEAIKNFEKTITLQPDNRFSYFYLGNALFNADRYEEAVANYQQAIFLGLNTPEIYFNLGNSYYKLQDYERSIVNYQAAIQLKPDYTLAMFNLANTYELLDDEETALIQYKRIVALDPQYYQAYYNIANYHKNLGELEKAIEYYQKSIDINENDDYAYSNMGDCYRMLGLYEEAEAAYRKAIEIDPENPIPYNNLSLTFYLQEDYLQSLEYLRKAARLGHYNAGNILKNMNLE